MEYKWSFFEVYIWHNTTKLFNGTMILFFNFCLVFPLNEKLYVINSHRFFLVLQVIKNINIFCKEQFTKYQFNVLILKKSSISNFHFSSSNFLQKYHCVVYEVVHQLLYHKIRFFVWIKPCIFTSFFKIIFVHLSSTFKICWNLRSLNSSVVSKNWLLNAWYCQS